MRQASIADCIDSCFWPNPWPRPALCSGPYFQQQCQNFLHFMSFTLFPCELPETQQNVDNGRHATNVPDYMKLALIFPYEVVIGETEAAKNQSSHRYSIQRRDLTIWPNGNCCEMYELPILFAAATAKTTLDGSTLGQGGRIAIETLTQ